MRLGEAQLILPVAAERNARHRCQQYRCRRESSDPSPHILCDFAPDIPSAVI
jgi:hypothetical protein